MSRVGRVSAEVTAARKAFLRRRTAVFFTFFFPLLLVVIFGTVIGTGAAGGFLGGTPAENVAAYLAVVVLFTPLSRVGSEVARSREGNRFEKLATTPLSRVEWLLAHSLVNVAVIGIAGLLLLVAAVAVTGAEVVVSPTSVLFVPAFVATGVVAFCGVGAVIGSVADSQDGVIAAANGLALPLILLSETFVPPAALPGWLPTELSPLTYFARGVRAVLTENAAGAGAANLAVLAAVAVMALLVGAVALPRTD
ncbi:ABC transporter permease [Halomicrobium urmianum]|uniref:ABC transporter permease n=1 Tax=Halomicrobium urmianum TaxID=1586233 RepID=UPI001CD99F63|nr:ABC transporter permease [Halomicrobium urmianum]